jgi:ADP-ribose pyrophosphatase
MTDANMQLVTIDCHLPPGTNNSPPKADLEEGEHIIQRVVAISELYDVLKSYGDKEGYTVDARLSHLVCFWPSNLCFHSVDGADPPFFCRRTALA